MASLCPTAGERVCLARDSALEAHHCTPQEDMMDKDGLWVVEHFSELVTKYAGKGSLVLVIPSSLADHAIS